MKEKLCAVWTRYFYESAVRLLGVDAPLCDKSVRKKSLTIRIYYLALF